MSTQGFMMPPVGFKGDAYGHNSPHPLTQSGNSWIPSSLSSSRPKHPIVAQRHNAAQRQVQRYFLPRNLGTGRVRRNSGDGHPTVGPAYRRGGAGHGRGARIERPFHNSDRIRPFDLHRPSHRSANGSVEKVKKSSDPLLRQYLKDKRREEKEEDARVRKMSPQLDSMIRKGKKASGSNRVVEDVHNDNFVYIDGGMQHSDYHHDRRDRTWRPRSRSPSLRSPLDRARGELDIREGLRRTQQDNLSAVPTSHDPYIEPAVGSESDTVQWNPQRIFDQWNVAFGTPGVTEQRKDEMQMLEYQELLQQQLAQQRQQQRHSKAMTRVISPRQLTQHEMEFLQASTPHIDYHDRPRDALSRARSQVTVQTMKRGLVPLHMPAHIQEERKQNLVKPIAANDFGNFSYKNLPVLEQANKDVIRKLRAEAMLPQNQSRSTQQQPTVMSPSPYLENSLILPGPLQRTLPTNRAQGGMGMGVPNQMPNMSNMTPQQMATIRQQPPFVDLPQHLQIQQHSPRARSIFTPITDAGADNWFSDDDSPMPDLPGEKVTDKELDFLDKFVPHSPSAQHNIRISREYVSPPPTSSSTTNPLLPRLVDRQSAIRKGKPSTENMSRKQFGYTISADHTKGNASRRRALFIALG